MLWRPFRPPSKSQETLEDSWTSLASSDRCVIERLRRASACAVEARKWRAGVCAPSCVSASAAQHLAREECSGRATR
eukprot:9473989-Pyramimonas_sp.AAC.1